MIGPVHIEVLLAAGYAGFLIAVAASLEWFGRHSHRRSGQLRTAGFKYHPHLDVWECPCGHHLHPHYRDPVRSPCEIDYDGSFDPSAALISRGEVVRYRAPAHTCNACAKKPDCTDSEHGREIIHSSESWIQTQAGRFHRGISLALLVLAALLLSVELFRYPNAPDLMLLGCVLVLMLARTLHLTRPLFVRGNKNAGRLIRAGLETGAPPEGELLSRSLSQDKGASGRYGI